MASYKNYGYGLYAVLLENNDKSSAETPDEKLIGMCGLLKRPELDYPDLGYAFLPEFCGKGYAKETAEAVLKNDVIAHSLNTILAVTSLTNQSSHNLLKKIILSKLLRALLIISPILILAATFLFLAPKIGFTLFPLTDE